MSKSSDGTLTRRTNASHGASYTSGKIGDIERLDRLPRAIRDDISLAALVFPFKVDDYVLETLIDWDAAPDDPIFRLIFPTSDMLTDVDRARLSRLRNSASSSAEIELEARRIRAGLNPHSSDQLANVPLLDGVPLAGVQHKYRETVLFFPKQGQTCHSYCSFCFRWPQFVDGGAPKFEIDEPRLLYRYLALAPDVSDILMTGGDPMVMNARRLRQWLEPVLAPELAHIANIRIGTKSLTYRPQRFLSDPDAEDLFALFRQLSNAGKHVALMAHINHPREMAPSAFRDAVEKLRAAGVSIRSQSPLLRGINASSDIWGRMWAEQTRLGILPYYMFIERDTGANRCFSVPLAEALRIYGGAVASVSGLGRTARGPIMSAGPGKVQILGKIEIGGDSHFVLSFLQARRRDWLHRPFLAAYSETANWLTDLKPSFEGKHFFFEEEYEDFLASRGFLTPESKPEAEYA